MILVVSQQFLSIYKRALSGLKVLFGFFPSLPLNFHFLFCLNSRSTLFQLNFLIEKVLVFGHRLIEPSGHLTHMFNLPFGVYFLINETNGYSLLIFLFIICTNNCLLSIMVSIQIGNILNRSGPWLKSIQNIIYNTKLSK